MTTKIKSSSTKPISTFVHGMMDYVGGIALVLAPEIFRFSDMGGPAVWVPRVIGIIILLQSIMTDYEVGIVKLLPMTMHLRNDYVASLLLAASPWIFGFRDAPAHAWVPHFVVGIGIFVASMLTETHVRRMPHQARTA